MKLTNSGIKKQVKVTVFLEVEDAPVMTTEGMPGEVYKIRPETIHGDWFEDGYLPARCVTVRGRVMNILSEAHLTKEFALHEGPSGDWIWPMAPEWVFEALREAGVEY
jgi:hypothetical protein